MYRNWQINCGDSVSINYPKPTLLILNINSGETNTAGTSPQVSRARLVCHNKFLSASAIEKCG